MTNKDIFISYKNDGEGNNFAARLCEDLSGLGYSVYFNSHERRKGEFPERLKNAIKECSDLILVLSMGCINWLKENNDEDWVREEILYAKNNNKNIVPILIGSASIPSKNDMPVELKFLPDIDSYYLPEQYIDSPLKGLLSMLDSRPNTNSFYMNEANSNETYNVYEDFEKTLQEAENGLPKAMYIIANMYFYGFANADGTTNRDFAKAFYWFEKLAKIENEYKAYADSMLGRMYYDGTVPGDNQSYEKALKYHLNSAENSEKFGYSASRVAFMKQYARGCDFNFEEVEKYYLSFIEKGDDILKMNLGDFMQTTVSSKRRLICITVWKIVILTQNIN
ncbi:MAG: toll/interleukin-1 receptor domain-containing protein [Oscillospiraceae bacterium]|nr:toll/interleukin-1 receptor domain-containing protein [Oscillospiraceae bacterium]